MKLAVLAESDADEIGLRILVEAVLGRPTIPIDHFRLMSRGWPSVLQVSPKVLWNSYFRTDADALVVLADSNHSAPHGSTLDIEYPNEHKRCRLCRLQQALSAAKSRARGRSDRNPIKTAVGIVVPSIEAWLLIGKDRRVGEADWVRALQETRFPYTKGQLKEALYGHERAPGTVVRARVEAEARRIASDPNLLAQLETYFPGGFGSMAGEIRAW